MAHDRRRISQKKFYGCAVHCSSANNWRHYDLAMVSRTHFVSFRSKDCDRQNNGYDCQKKHEGAGEMEGRAAAEQRPPSRKCYKFLLVYQLQYCAIHFVSSKWRLAPSHRSFRSVVVRCVFFHFPFASFTSQCSRHGVMLQTTIVSARARRLLLAAAIVVAGANTISVSSLLSLVETIRCMASSPPQNEIMEI